MNVQCKARPPTAADKAWAAQQIATIVGSTKEDSEPLADFLLGIEDANELQGQLLDMLGESPLALDFAFALIAKRFPADEKSTEPPSLPPRSSPSPQNDGSAQGAGSKVVAYRKANPDDIAYFNGTSSQGKDQASTSVAETKEQPAPAEYKSQRQIKRERQEKARREKEEAERLRQRAKRKRVKCECQAAEHPLLTNCLSCGRIICDSEGPGPCMSCGNEVDSPDQQLQQHMQRLLNRTQENDSTQSAKGTKGPAQSSGPKSAKSAATGSSYSRKAGGTGAAPSSQLLWEEPKETQATETVAALTETTDLTEEEYLELAFRVLGIDKQTADEAAIREAESWVKATRRKERLLGFDRTAAQRTRLIDQSADFDPDAIGKWMSPEEKANAEQRQVERRKVEEEREARLRRGMRVLRLNFKDSSVDIQRESEDSEMHALNPEPKQPAKKPAVVPEPRPAAQQASGNQDAGAFAHNPLLGKVSEPKFILSAKQGSKKSRGKAKQQQEREQEQERPQSSDNIARQRQTLRIQSDMTDTFF